MRDLWKSTTSRAEGPLAPPPGFPRRQQQQPTFCCMLLTIFTRRVISSSSRILPNTLLPYQHRPPTWTSPFTLPSTPCPPSSPQLRRWYTMSDSEVSDFRYDDSDSDGYAEPTVTKKAPAKKAAASKATKVSHPHAFPCTLHHLTPACCEEGSHHQEASRDEAQLTKRFHL